jgi:hypothetical protein
MIYVDIFFLLHLENYVSVHSRSVYFSINAQLSCSEMQFIYK